MEPNQPPKNEDEKLLDAPPEEKRIDPPEEEKLLPDHASGPGTSVVGKKLLIILGFLALLLVASGAYYFMTSNNSQTDPIETGNTIPAVPHDESLDDSALDENDSSPSAEEMQTACTMDALLCPDGTAVGREGPDCEFAACPGE